MKNIAQKIQIGVKALAGIGAGYLVYKVIDDKANELVKNGGAVNAFVVGAGQSAIALTVGKVVYWLF